MAAEDGKINIAIEGWLSDPSGDVPEGATSASIRISSVKSSLSQLLDYDALTVRDEIRVSALRLAEWFASNWWRLMYEPFRDTLDWRLSHCMASVGSGYVWPNILFSSDEHIIQIFVKSTEREDFTDIRFLTDEELSVTTESFADSLDQFFSKVEKRLIDRKLKHCNFLDLLDDLRHERADSQLTRLRKIEALLGYDPEEAPNNIITYLLERVKDFGEDATEELAAENTKDLIQNIDLLREEVAKSNNKMSFDKIKHKKMSIDYSKDSWINATEAARNLREYLGIRSGPIEDDQILSFFQIENEKVFSEPATEQKFVIGQYNSKKPDSLNFLVKSAQPTGRRFELMRYVADHLVKGYDDKILPITNARTYRQRFQRAFAQEFMCPWREIARRLENKEPDNDFIELSAADYMVSPLTVRSLLVNKGRLNRKQLLDDV